MCDAHGRPTSDKRVFQERASERSSGKVPALSTRDNVIIGTMRYADRGREARGVNHLVYSQQMK